MKRAVRKRNQSNKKENQKNNKSHKNMKKRPKANLIDKISPKKTLQKNNEKYDTK